VLSVAAAFLPFSILHHSHRRSSPHFFSFLYIQYTVIDGNRIFYRRIVYIG
jgi:hypothetical protein